VVQAQKEGTGHGLIRARGDKTRAASRAERNRGGADHRAKPGNGGLGGGFIVRRIRGRKSNKSCGALGKKEAKVGKIDPLKLK